MPKRYSDSWFVDQYFRHGSIKGVFDAFSRENSGKTPPIAEASYHRILNNFGVEKNVPGPKTSLLDAILFFEQMIVANMPLERVYSQMSASFKERIHLPTLHRIHNSILCQLARRHATAVIATPRSNPESLVIGTERTQDLKYGKHIGDATVPMSYTSGKSSKSDVAKVIQSELFTNLAVQRRLTMDWDSKEVMSIQIVDVKVDVYHVLVPDQLCSAKRFSSYKLNNHRIVNLQESSGLLFRQGVSEMLHEYTKFLATEEYSSPLITSNLNLAVLSL